VTVVPECCPHWNLSYTNFGFLFSLHPEMRTKPKMFFIQTRISHQSHPQNRISSTLLTLQSVRWCCPPGLMHRRTVHVRYILPSRIIAPFAIQHSGAVALSPPSFADRLWDGAIERLCGLFLAFFGTVAELWRRWHLGVPRHFVTSAEVSLAFPVRMCPLVTLNGNL
jgi:hypothetical protein